MKIFVHLVYISIAILLSLYVLYPNKPFPEPPPGAVQSQEEADTEDPERRAYFTNYKREELMSHYKSQMAYLPTLRLNYPPEEAQTLIRDQTRSRYLEEYAHPFRESIFVNGFFPQEAKDDIWYKGEHFETKVTVRYVTTKPIVRFIILILGLICLYLVGILGSKSLKDGLIAIRRLKRRA